MQKEKPPAREREEELDKMKMLPVEDQLEYLLVKAQAHEKILQNILFTLDIAERKAQEFLVESSIELRKHLINARLNM